MNKNILMLFSKNRAEEYPSDFWDNFVIPPRYENYSCLFNYRKTVMIEGGRGSGKTTFIKYHCHQTRFSKKREFKSIGEFKHIGLYFRPDTDFCSMINQTNFGEKWKFVFKHYLYVMLLEEFSLSLENISKSHFDDGVVGVDILDLEIPKSLSVNIEGFPCKYRNLKKYQEDLVIKLNIWVSNIDTRQEPVFFDPIIMFKSLIKGLSTSSETLSDLCFFVYIDEFENLASSQQQIINSWMKHGQNPLIINAAYKRAALVNKKTSSTESLVARDDYRVVDLEDLERNDFSVFAAQVLCLKLATVIKYDNYKDLKHFFADESRISVRHDDDKYLDLAKGVATSLLPSQTYREMASTIMSTSVLRNRLEMFLIPECYKKDIHMYVDDDYPAESLVNAVLLNRRSADVKNIAKMFIEFKKGHTKIYGNLIEQNLVGAILWIYKSASWKNCPIYSGFNRFCLLSHNNMRHFLELCHQAISVADRNDVLFSDHSITPISIEHQSEGATLCSRMDLIKIDELGKNGKKLRFIANRLGLFFQLFQKRKSQSETEVNHFSIKLSEVENLNTDSKKLIEEAIMWSVLVRLDGDTKRKNISSSSSTEYMLHPIYSPYFGISFRRKKKVDFSVKQITILLEGDEKEFTNLCTEYTKKWKDDGIIEPENSAQNSVSFENNQRVFLWEN